MDQLVQELIAKGFLQSPSIVQAFLHIDRAHFVSKETKHLAHQDIPLYIGYEQTIPKPSTVARMLELLSVEPGEKVLDIGSGTGWTTALLGYITGKQGFVTGLERIEELVRIGQNNINQYNLPHIHIEKAGTILGKPHESPYQKILVSASTQTFPQELILQVAEGGVLVIPVLNSIWKIRRIEHQPLIEKYNGYSFVPLIT